MRRLGRVVLAAALGGALLGLPAVASAVHSSSTAAETNQFTAGALATPAGLRTMHPTVTGTGDGDVRLTWTDALTRAVTYLVQRAPAGSPTSWTTVNGSGSGSAALCSGGVPGTVTCTYDDNAASSTIAPAYNASYVYQVVAKVGGWIAPSGSRLAGSLPPASGSETYLVPPDLNAVSAKSATQVWAVGANCTVDYYDGTSWTLQTVPTAVCPAGTSLNGVDANGGLPMVVGGVGVSFLCTAGCTTATPTWSAKPTPGFPTLYAVSAAGATSMWAVGQNCSLLYYNGSWTTVTVATTSCAAGTALYGVEANGGFPVMAGAAGTLFTCTKNCVGTGTPNLTNNAPAALAGATFYAVTMVSTSAVWAVGSGGAIAACNSSCTGAGSVWISQASGTTSTLRAVHATTTTFADAVGDGGTILQCTTNCTKGTAAWSQKTSNTTNDLTGVNVLPAGAIAVGRVGTIVVLGGWAPMDTTTPEDLKAVSAASATSVWAVGANCTVDHYDGTTWTLQAVPTSTCPSGTSLNGVDANAGSPIVVGDGGVTFLCSAGCSTASPTWTALASGSTQALYAVSAWPGKSPAQVWAAGANCTVLFYNGTTWTSQAAPAGCTAGTTLYGVDANGGKPVFAGANTTVFTCTGGCNATPSWTLNDPGAPAGTTFYAVNAQGNVWAVGSGGVIAVCTGSCNGTGATWTTQTSGVTDTLRAVYASSTSLVDVVGDAGNILQCTVSCTKGGGVWSGQASPTTTNLTGVYVVSASKAYVVGQAGTAAGVGTGAFAVVLSTALPVDVPTTYALVGADLTQLSEPDGALYAAHGAWPSTTLPTACTSSTPSVVVRPASSVPSGSWGLTKAVATVLLQVDAAPAADAAFQLLVSPDNGASWTSYPVSTPTAAGMTAQTSVDVTTTVGTTSALATTQLCLQGTSGSGPALTPTVDLMHLDVN